MVRYKFVHFNKRSDFDSYVPNPESNSANGNEYYNYVVFIKDTKEIYTHGQFYNCSDSGDSSIDEILEELKSSINSKADLSSLEALIKEVEENEEVTAAALTELHENKADKSEIPDVSNLVTKNEFNILSAEVEEKVDSTTFTKLSETVAGHTTNINNLSNNKADKIDLENYAEKNALNTKQDQLVSGINIKTVNDNTILGSGNIETPDTKVTSADNHYGYDANNAISTTGAFVTKITKDAANHVTSFESRALISTDIPELDASKITSGEISIDRLPKGALERLFVVESEAAAISATVQEGDVVQVTGNNNKMYFCISNTATTFATKFKEFTAGTATSVPWSGITGKPTGIDGWGDRIGIIESGYATQSWVGDNYLSKNGGKIIGKGDYAFVQLRLSGNIATIMFEQNEVEKGCIGWMGNTGIRIQNSNEYGLAVTDSNVPIFYWGQNGSVRRILLHAGNYSDYALPITGGRISGDLKLTSREVGNDNAHSGKLIFAGANNDYGNNDYKMGPYIQAINIGGWGKKKISFFQRDWSVECFDADPEEVFSIMPNGNILIGSTEDSGEKLQVNGNVKANNFIGSLTGTADNASKLDGKSLSQIIKFEYADNSDGVIDLNNSYSDFTYISSNWPYNGYVNVSNSPWSASAASVWTLPGNYNLQIAKYYKSNDVRIRGRYYDGWTDWVSLVHSGNISSFNAGSAYKLRFIAFDNNSPSLNTLLLGGGIINNYADINYWKGKDAPEGISYGCVAELSAKGDSGLAAQLAWDVSHRGADSTRFLWWRASDDTGFANAKWHKIAFTDSNVASATKLATPRTIWGQSFDGTGNVGGDLYVHQLKIELGNEINSYTNNFNTANGNVHLNFHSSGHVTLAKGGGNVAIGGVATDEKLHVYGNVKASGSMYAVDFATTSDNRLKDFVSDIYVDFESIKQIPKKYYYWKDKSMGEDLQIGTSAQELAKIYPECVHYDETNDRYSVNYQKLSIVALAAIDKLHDRVSELESKLYDKNN